MNKTSPALVGQSDVGPLIAPFGVEIWIGLLYTPNHAAKQSSHDPWFIQVVDAGVEQETNKYWFLASLSIGDPSLLGGFFG